MARDIWGGDSGFFALSFSVSYRSLAFPYGVPPSQPTQSQTNTNYCKRQQTTSSRGNEHKEEFALFANDGTLYINNNYIHMSLFSKISILGGMRTDGSISKGTSKCELLV